MTSYLLTSIKHMVAYPSRIHCILHSEGGSDTTRTRLLHLVCLSSNLGFLLNPYTRVSRAQTEQATSTPCCGQENQIAPRQLHFPYYSLKDGFRSSVLFVSGSPDPFDFVMAVRSRSGQTVLAPTLTIQPQEKLPVDLATLLAEEGADVTGDFSEGSVTVYYSGKIMPLAGQLTMSNPARKMIFESEMVDNSPGLRLLPTVLNGVWWGLGSGREASIIVTNTSGEAVSAEVLLDFLGERHAAAPLAMRPFETKVLSVAELLGDLKTSPAQAPEGGITIVPRGPKPSLIAQGKITDSVTGFSTTLNFPLPDQQQASALHASGVPIGTPSQGSPFAGLGTFVPHVVVRNLLGTPQIATITIEYPQPEARWDSTEGPALREEPKKEVSAGETSELPPGEPAPIPEADSITDRLVLPPLVLGPYGTKDFSLDAAMGQLPAPLPFCSIRIEYSGAPGTAIAEVSSIELKGDLVIDSRVNNEADWLGMSGAHPWHLDDETDSILFLTNMTDQVGGVGFQVQAGGVHYHLTRLRLAGHETRAIDLRKLRDAQKPDLMGNMIPAAATDGSVLWIRFDGPVTGRLVVLKRHQGMASNYTCSGGCICQPTFDHLEVVPLTWAGVPGDSTLFIGRLWKRDCYNNTFYCDLSGGPWSSQNPSVASVTPGGGWVTAQSGGGTAIKLGPITTYAYTPVFRYPSWYCQACAIPPQTAGTAYVVAMSGPQTVWWFNGQTPSGYETTITLTALPSGASSYSWSLLTGTDKAFLSGQSGNTIHLTGNDHSTSLNDVTVRVSVTTPGGTKSATRTATVRGPKRLVPAAPPFLDTQDSDHGFLTYVSYTIQDNLSTPLPSIVRLNENWTTSVSWNPPYSPQNSNWSRPNPGGFTTETPMPSQFADHISGPLLGTNPPPSPTPTYHNPPSGPLVFYWGQEWRIGSLSAGAGARVQTNTLQVYTDHGRHTGITSPAP